MVSSLKNLAHENKNLHSNIFSKLSATLHTHCSTHICSTHSKFAPPTPNLLHPHQICSTHSKFVPPTPNLLRSLIFRCLAHVSTLYQYKTKVLFFLPNANKFPNQIFSTSTPLAHSPHPLRSLILHIHSAPLLILHVTPPTHNSIRQWRKMLIKLYPYQLHPQQFLSSSSSFYIMLHIKRDKCVYYYYGVFKTSLHMKRKEI